MAASREEGGSDRRRGGGAAAGGGAGEEVPPAWGEVAGAMVGWSVKGRRQWRALETRYFLRWNSPVSVPGR